MGTTHMLNPQAQAPTLSPNDVLNSENIVCECGNKIFNESVILKKVSKFITGTPNDTIYPIPVYCCAKCGKIPKEFLEKTNANKILGEDIKSI